MVRRGILWDGPIQAKTGTVQFLNRVPRFESGQGYFPFQRMVDGLSGCHMDPSHSEQSTKCPRIVHGRCCLTTAGSRLEYIIDGLSRQSVSRRAA
jgi:hypothetical protein